MKKSTYANKVKNIIKKAQNTVGTVIAAPAIVKSKTKQNRADSDFKALKKAKEYAGAPDFDDYGKPTDAFKARTVADGVKQRLTRKKK